MANADAAMGLKPVRYLGGAVYTGASNRYFVPDTDATAIFIGGLVKEAGEAASDGTPIVTGDVATGDAVVGVVVGVEPVTSGSTTYREASTARYIFVADDPNLLFEVQADGQVSPFAVGTVADLEGFTSGSTVTGLSSIEMSGGTYTTTGDGTEDIKLVRLADRPDNDIAEPNANWLVRLNQHAYVNGNTGA